MGDEHKTEDKIKWDGRDILVLLQIVTDDNRNYKKQQFIIVNYALLLIGAIFTFYRLFIKDYNNCIVKSTFFILTILIAALGTYYICNLQETLRIGRKQLKKIYEKLSQDFKYCLGEIPDNYTNFSYYFGSFALPFIIILWVAVGLATWYIFI